MEGGVSTPPSTPPSRDHSAAPRSRIPTWLPILSVLLTGLFLVGLFSTEIADSDFWWHLKTGQYIVQRHSLPVPDPFSFSTALNLLGRR